MKSFLLALFISAAMAEYQSSPQLPPLSSAGPSSKAFTVQAQDASVRADVTGQVSGGAFSLPPPPSVPMQGASSYGLPQSQQQSYGHPLPQQQSYGLPSPPQASYGLPPPPPAAYGPGPMFPPQVPGFFFNAGFDKGLGFRFPPLAEPFQVTKSPLGELFAAKADLLPYIFKTGLLITLFFLVVKFIAAVIQAKVALLSGLKAPIVTTVPVATPVSPAVTLGTTGGTAGSGIHVASATLSATDAMGKSSAKNKKEKRSIPDPQTSGSPVVGSDVDLDEMTARIASYL